MSSPGNPDEPALSPTRNLEPDEPGSEPRTRTFAPIVAADPPPEATDHPEEISPPAPAPASTSAPAPASTPAPAPAPAEFDAADRPAARMRTVVLGLVLLIVAVMVMVGELTDLNIDLGAIVLAAMIGCGLLLVAGARRT
jgi:hypothetical protein